MSQSPEVERERDTGDTSELFAMVPRTHQRGCQVVPMFSLCDDFTN